MILVMVGCCLIGGGLKGMADNFRSNRPILPSTAVTEKEIQ